MSDTVNTEVVLQGAKQEHGCQVILSRAASAYARGGVHDNQIENIQGKRALEASGEQADGHSVDGTSVTGKRQIDDVLATASNIQGGTSSNVRIAEGSEGTYRAAGLAGTTHTPAPDGKGGPGNAAGTTPAPEPAKAS